MSDDLRELVSPADLDDLVQAVIRGELTLAQVGAFDERELDGAYVAAVRLLEAGRPAKCLQVVGMLMTVDPERPRYFQLAGLALHRMSRFVEADAYYRVAQTLDPSDPLTLLYRGECSVLLGELARGHELLQRGMNAAHGRAELSAYVARARTILATSAPHGRKDA